MKIYDIVVEISHRWGAWIEYRFLKSYTSLIEANKEAIRIASDFSEGREIKFTDHLTIAELVIENGSVEASIKEVDPDLLDDMEWQLFIIKKEVI